MEDSCGDALRVEWRSFLLRPRPSSISDLEKFRAYTQSWLRPAAEADAGTFQVWRGDAGPPSHSIPPHLVAKAAARIGEDAFRRIHARLLAAYFTESRDVTDAATLRALWRETGLPDADFEQSEDPALLREVLTQHEQALQAGVTGVPAVQIAGNDAVIVGAHPLELYRRWFDRTRESRAPGRGN